MKKQFLCIFVIGLFYLCSCKKTFYISDYNLKNNETEHSRFSSYNTLSSTDLTVISVTATSELMGWPTLNLIDGNSSSSWSSIQHGTSFNSTESVSYAFNTASIINYIKLTPRYDAGVGALGFPVDFSIYYFSNNSWILWRSFVGFPVPQRQPVVISFASAVVTSQIKITATKLGTDGYDAIFQLSEVTAGDDPGFDHFKFIGNNGSFQQNRINNVMAGIFNPNKVSTWSLDDRYPLIAAKPGGYSNVYAPYAVSNLGAWNVYFGGLDGTTDFHDRISVAVTLDSFKTLNPHVQVIDNGQLDHVNNETVVKRSDGSWLMTYTGKLFSPALNKPYYSLSSDGVHWVPGAGSSTSNYIIMTGYANWNNADVNGSNVVLLDNSQYYLYFTDFNSVVNGHSNNVHYATSTDNINYTYQGDALNQPGIANDIRKFNFNGTSYYVMGLHINGPSIYYSISNNPASFPSASIFFTETNQYLTSLSFVSAGNSLYGILYGGGSASTLDQNSIRARWLTKKIVFISDGTGTRWGDFEYAHGPNQVILLMNTNIETGHFYIYDTDGTTLLYTSPQVTMKSGDIWDFVE